MDFRENFSNKAIILLLFVIIKFNSKVKMYRKYILYDCVHFLKIDPEPNSLTPECILHVEIIIQCGGQCPTYSTAQ